MQLCPNHGGGHGDLGSAGIAMRLYRLSLILRPVTNVAKVS
jgi:hypothetical protein